MGFCLIAMKSPRLFLSASFVLLALTGAAAAPASPAKTPAEAKPAATPAANPESTLKQGMPAEVVRQIMGQPAEVTPMKAKDGKAEIWVYKRSTNVRVERVPVGSTPVTVTSFGSDGKAHEQTIGEKVQYGDLYKATEETIQLLMFNDQYVTQKTSSREVQHYN